ncbi:MAG: hypothetical protein KDK74_11460 [Cephaloticoccus sp.]|nr:hypothetical protein [Cephaloticoccus sp.]
MSQRQPRAAWGWLLVFGLVAASVRAAIIWFSRPEFVGWFNHTYYYYVQTRGLLENGAIPYPDMPLLFWLYALSAKVLMGGGMAQHDAIVHASRFWMCLLPALLVWPCYTLLRQLNPTSKALGLAAVAGFLPLTVVHMPEMLQKNMLGLVLLAVALALTREIQIETSWRRVSMAVLLSLVMVLTHFGTAIALMFWIVAFSATRAVITKQVGTTIRLVVWLTVAGATFLSLIGWFDPARVARVWHYLRISFNDSWVGVFFGMPEERVTAAIVIIVYAVVMVWLIHMWRRHHKKASAADAQFWLCCVLFAGLLMVPVWERAVSARLMLFLGPPILCILALHDRHVWSSKWMRRLWLPTVTGVAALLVVGESVGTILRARGSSAIHADLMQLKHAERLGPDDFVIAPTGAEHASNWFLGTKAGVITSLGREDFAKYRRVYVLNPIEGELNFRDLAGVSASTPEKAYLIMRRNIPRPSEAEIVLTTPRLECFRLKTMPVGWEVDELGTWSSYGDFSH